MKKTDILSSRGHVFNEEKSKQSAPVVTWEEIVQYIRDTYHPPRKFKHNIIVLQNPPFSALEHAHTFFVMVYILSGHGTHLINQHPESFCTGDLYILPPKARHSLGDSPDCVTIMIHPDAFESIFSGILNGRDCLGDFLMNSLYRDNSETYLLFHTGHNNEMRDIMMQMLDIMANADDYTDRILSGMILLLSTSLLRTHQDAVRTAPESGKVSEIVSLIYEHYDTITLAALAEKLHYTVPYCSKYLKNHLGCNFSELLGRIRFQKAENLLVNSEMTIAEISRTLGYENPENFVRAFKSRYRMTPSQFRTAQLSSAAEIPPPVGIWVIRTFRTLLYRFLPEYEKPDAGRNSFVQRTASGFLYTIFKSCWLFPFFPFII
mgnify:CR=1 FL=1